MANEETIQLDILNFDWQPAAAVTSLIKIAEEDDTIIYVKDSFTSYIGDEKLDKSVVLGIDGTEAYRVIAAGTRKKNGISFNYIELDHGLLDDAPELTDVYISNVISQNSLDLVLDITADRFDVDDLTCLVQTSGTINREYSETFAMGYVSESAVSTYATAAVSTLTTDLRADNRTFTFSGTLAAGHKVQFEFYDNDFIIQEVNGANATVRGSIPIWEIAKVATGGAYEYTSNTTAERGTFSSTDQSTDHSHDFAYTSGGGTGLTSGVNFDHHHDITSHTHPMNTHNDTIPIMSGTETLVEGAWVQIRGISYQVASGSSLTSLVIEGGLMSDVFENDNVYALYMPPQDIKSTLWRHRSRVILPAVINNGTGLQKLVIRLYLNESAATSTDYTYFIHRCSPQVTVEDLGDNKFRLHHAGTLTPSGTFQVLMTGVTDVFGIQSVSDGPEFEQPSQPGWKAGK